LDIIITILALPQIITAMAGSHPPKLS